MAKLHKPAKPEKASRGERSAMPFGRPAEARQRPPVREPAAKKPRPEPARISPFDDRKSRTAPVEAETQRILGARISRRAADRLRSGHVWVYASDIESLGVNGDVPPALLPVADNRGIFLGTALYSPHSQIALRLVAREALDEPAWLDLLETRLRTAIARRKPLLDEATDACRLVFSEADELPGLVIDKYGDLAILQILARGLDSSAVRERCVGVLGEQLRPRMIVERPDPRVRELEGLSAPEAGPLWSQAGQSTELVTRFHLNGLTFRYDANAGQKTGAFLDQRLNYAAAADWAIRLGAGGRALDVCTYQGGFALHLARVCRQVTGIDASRASLEVAEQNVQANRPELKAEVDWVEGDAFQILRDWSLGGERFDTIVLDPPAFAKSRRAVEGALRGYKELNLRALKMLGAGGLLVTCSCSHHVSLADLEATVASAAADAGRRVRLLERRGAAPDHPVILNLPETEYLKCLVLQVE